MIVRNAKHIDEVRFDGGEYRGCSMRRLISAEDGASSFSMRVFTLDPHGFTPFHAHQHEHEVYILAGNGFMRTATEEIAVAPGDSILLGPFDHHQFTAGAAGLEFICCVPHH
jgi:quercetin dioxygenase-like cupin family protein